MDMCHVALGIVEAYWEYRLKPWDMAAGVLVIPMHHSYWLVHHMSFQVVETQEIRWSRKLRFLVYEAKRG